MIEFSSFMIPWNAIFSILSGSAFIATIAMAFLLFKAQSKLVAQDPHCTSETFWTGLVVTAICSIVLVLILQVVANYAFNVAFDGDNMGEKAQVGAQFSKNPRSFAVLIVTLLVGGGYAFSFVEASLITHIFSCTIGIGFLEEAAKAFSAIIIFSMFYKGNGYRHSLAPFVIAGLGFGAGEALHYFATYNLNEMGFGIYLVRAWWCVALHAAWTLIVGDFIIRAFNGIPSIDQLSGDDYGKLIGCLLPSMVMHGFYNAFCFHNIPLSWVVGIGSLIWGFSLLNKPKPEFVALR
jgi:RsiW-degrading membrane proteinase PrsW (M82 family)